jgi:hypothetical protein
VKFSKDYVLFFHITTQIQGEKHGNLLEEKGGEGFPHIVFMDAEGKVLAVHEEDRTAAAFAKTGEKAKAFITLKAKAAKGDKAAKVDFILAEMDLGQLKPDEAQKQLNESASKLTKEQQQKLDGMMLNLSIMEIVKGIDSEEAAKAAGKKFYDMQKAGKPGPSSEQAVQPYYILGMNAAEEAKDAATFEKDLKALKEKFADNPRAQKFFEAQEKKLEALKGDKK